MHEEKGGFGESLYHRFHENIPLSGKSKLGIFEAELTVSTLIGIYEAKPTTT